MKFGIVITMFDEHELVLSSIQEIRENCHQAYICVVHSDDNNKTASLEKIINLVDKYYILPNLALDKNFDAKLFFDISVSVIFFVYLILFISSLW